jgi:hypothetical protein
MDFEELYARKETAVHMISMIENEKRRPNNVCEIVDEQMKKHKSEMTAMMSMLCRNAA